MGFASRLPTANEPAVRRWPYAPREPHDDVSALLGVAARCRLCRRVTRNECLSDAGVCPACRPASSPTPHAPQE